MSAATWSANQMAAHTQFLIPPRKVAPMTDTVAVTPEQERIIREAHWALEARGRGKGGVHTTTDACRVIRSLLDVLAEVTGVGSSSETLL
jgi:hypothetical protein